MKQQTFKEVLDEAIDQGLMAEMSKKLLVAHLRELKAMHDHNSAVLRKLIEGGKNNGTTDQT